MRRVVITGYGAITPIGSNASANWESLMASRSGIDQVKQFDTTGYTCTIGGEVKDYTPADHFNSKDLRKITRFIQFALIAGDEAIKHSGLDMEKEDPTRVGCIVGVGMGGHGFYSGSA